MEKPVAVARAGKGPVRRWGQLSDEVGQLRREGLGARSHWSNRAGMSVYDRATGGRDIQGIPEKMGKAAFAVKYLEKCWMGVLNLPLMSRPKIDENKVDRLLH